MKLLHLTDVDEKYQKMQQQLTKLQHVPYLNHSMDPLGKMEQLNIYDGATSLGTLGM